MQLVIEVHERLPLVEGDFGQLQQVLLNLLQNAQQAIEESAKGNTAGVRAYCAIPGRVRLEVWDDGPGIPGSLRARIFDPFFTTKGPEKGTGLGLAHRKRNCASARRHSSARVREARGSSWNCRR